MGNTLKKWDGISPITGGDWNDLIDELLMKTFPSRPFYFNFRYGILEPKISNWYKYANNPVIDKGAAGQWDDQHVAEGVLIRLKKKYIAFYNGTQSAPAWQIGIAISDDLKTFTKYAGNPVFTLGASGEWDDSCVKGTSLVKVGDEWWMYYHGMDEPTWETRNEKIGLAISKDLINWTRYAGNPILSSTDLGLTETPEKISNASVIRDTDGTFYLACAHYAKEDIYLAKSSDGKTGWTPHPNNPIIRRTAGEWNSDRVQDPTLIKLGGKWCICYGGGNGVTLGFGLAFATDPWGTWEDWEGNPFLTVNKVFLRQSLTFLDGVWILFYDDDFKGLNYSCIGWAAGNIDPSIL